MSQSASADTPKKNLKGTLVLFLSIVISIVLFMLVAILFGQVRGALMPELARHRTLLTIGIVIVCFVCLFVARMLWAKGMHGAKDPAQPLNTKLNLHRAALLRYLVLCEIPVMASLVLFLLTANFAFQVYAGIFVGFMLTMTPTRKKVSEELALSSQEQQELQ